MNEMSGRYSELPDEFYIPQEGTIGIQSSTNKQVRNISGDRDPYENVFRNTLIKDGSQAFKSYKNALERGVPREIARSGLPVNTFTIKVWQMNLHNLLHFLRLRLDTHAQYEIREYAKIIEQIVANYFPLTYNSWVNHIKDSISFSKDELEILSKYLQENKHQILDQVGHVLDNKSRRREFSNKLNKIIGNNDE